MTMKLTKNNQHFFEGSTPEMEQGHIPSEFNIKYN